MEMVFDMLRGWLIVPEMVMAAFCGAAAFSLVAVYWLDLTSWRGLKQLGALVTGFFAVMMLAYIGLKFVGRAQMNWLPRLGLLLFSLGVLEVNREMVVIHVRSNFGGSYRAFIRGHVIRCLAIGKTKRPKYIQ